MNDLLDRKTSYCGTIRSNRNTLTKEVTSKTMTKREICDQKHECEIKIIQWRGKRTVLTLTSKFRNSISLYNTGKEIRPYKKMRFWKIYFNIK